MNCYKHIFSCLSLLLILSFPVSIQAKKVVDLPQIKTPRSMRMDKNRLYITERSKVYIYSLGDFKFISSLGREGQGPQEFQTLPYLPISIDVTTDKLVVSSMRKISYFSKDGKFLEEKRAKSLALTLLIYRNGFLGRSQVRDKGVIYNTVFIYDKELNKVKEVFRQKDPYQGPGKGYQVLHGVFNYAVRGDMFIVPNHDSSGLVAFGKDYRKKFEIAVNQEPRKVDAAYKKTLTGLYKNSPETKNAYEQIKPLRFPETFPIIADFFMDGDTIYIITNQEKDGASQYFTYGSDGKLKKEGWLKLQNESEMRPFPTLIHNGNVCQLVENEETEAWEFHISDLD